MRLPSKTAYGLNLIYLRLRAPGARQDNILPVEQEALKELFGLMVSKHSADDMKGSVEDIERWLKLMRKHRIDEVEEAMARG